MSLPQNISQLLLRVGVLNEDELLDIFGNTIDNYKAEAKRARLSLKHDRDSDNSRDVKSLRGVIDEINSQWEPWNMKVAKMKYKTAGRFVQYYGVVNILEEDGMCKQDWLSKSEQEFFHLLVAEILDADSKTIDAVQAVNLGRDLTTTTRLNSSDATKCLDKLEKGQWLAKDSDEGSYALGVRTELQRRYWSDDAPAAKKSAKQARATQELDEEAEPEPQPKRARDGGGEDVD